MPQHCLPTRFDNNFLDLNVTKTKKLCKGGNGRVGNASHIYKSINIKGQEMEQVTTFKYLEQ